MTKLSSIVNAGLGRVGLRVQRLPGGEGGGTSFYKVSPTCQIRELATLYRLFLGERSDGFFVEVGAFDGISFSNSSCLADAGWMGLLVEPIPEFAAACRARYADNPRVRVVEAAAGAEAATVEITIAGSLTTTNRQVLEAYRDITWARGAVRDARRIHVAQRRLDDILEEAAPGRAIDVLIIDVEGAEAAVLAGFALERRRPRMLIVELVHTHPDLHAVSAGDADIQRHIERCGYTVVYKDAINTVFAADR